MRKYRIYKTPEEVKGAHLDQINRRNRTKMSAFTFRFDSGKDADVIEWIRRQSNKTEAVRSLIRMNLDQIALWNGISGE